MKRPGRRSPAASVAAAVVAAGAVLSCPLVLGPLITSDGRLDPPLLEVLCWIASACLLAIALALVLTPPQTSRRILAALARAVLIAVSATATLGLGELCLRLLAAGPRDQPVDGHEFSYVAHTNGAGYRDGEFEAAKAPGSLRVLVIGDSFVYGSGVADADSIPTLLEQSLSALAGRPVDVLNLGIPGADTYDYVRRASEFAGYAPDLVVLALYVDNDIEALPPPARIPTLMKNLRLVGLVGRLEARNPLGACDGLPGVDPYYADLACRARINASLFARATVGDNHAYYDALTERFLTLPFTRANVRAVRDTFAGLPFLLVVIPSKYQVSNRYFDELGKLGFRFSRNEPVSDALQQAICGWASGESIPCLDLLPALRAAPSVPHYFAIDDHFDPEGNRLAARLVTEWVAEQRIFAASEVADAP